MHIDLDRLRERFERDGYAVVPGLLGAGEVAELRAAFEAIHRAGVPEGAYSDGITDPNDPLARWPRIVHPHRFDATARRYLLHPRVRACLEALFGEEPVATQSMYYFKPPGARGQALHQDNLYLLVDPGTCIAAWTALDRVDRQNGGMLVVPGTQHGSLLCQEKADVTQSFTGVVTPVPKGMKAVDVEMEPGDTLFFGGALIHGSGPNRTADRFRRTFIGHYAAGSLEKISKFYLPLVRMDGTDCEVAANAGGGSCGEAWQGGVH